MSRRRPDFRAHARELRAIIVLIALMATFRSSIADWNDVPTQSMEPTILTGDRIAVNKLAYDLRVPFTRTRVASWDDPEIGEVIIFFAPHNDKRMVKRVIGTPGDTLAMKNGQLAVNGQVVPLTPKAIEQLGTLSSDPADLTDPAPHLFARETLGKANHAVMALPARRAARRSFNPIVVPAGQYFVMGDNRDNSGDSRVFGYVPRDRIVGRVSGIALSFDRKKWYSARWGRFARGID